MEDTFSIPSARIAIFSSPGMGHLIPVAELSKWLVHHHHLSVSLITQSINPVSHTQQQTFLNVLSNDKNIDIVSLPPPLEVLSNNTKMENLIFPTITYNTSHLRGILTSLAKSTPLLVALVVDLFGAGVIHVAEEIGIEPYMYFTSTCTLLAFSFHFPLLDATFQGDFNDLKELRLPGCVPMCGRDFPDTNEDRESEAYKGMLWLVKQYRLMKGILVNSFDVLEAGAVDGFKKDLLLPPIYPIGPMVRSSSAGDGEGSVHHCLKWLDTQPQCSVLYVSFGSGGTITRKQMDELAFGLEMSGQRFLWVVKSPDEMVSCGTYFGDQSQRDPLSFLPQGFLERTKEFGLVVPSWAPQVEVLGHVSTEQKMNAVLVVDGVRLALRPRVCQSGVVEREELCKVIKCLFEEEEGKKLRATMNEVSAEAARALEDGGSSFRAISTVVNKWKEKTKPCVE
ncbi:hypothetical protein J5N97_024851 [Dioscorea zingiberensis]|uniref:Glycosyltransferase n=1 Tax=Dioscorea zingiberensis TaxID=325984 RepID=A0A9D5C872_9LILI|nr:hypothetical protein J5N97_024851 [Dioscorea zingiberensis]